MQFAINYSPQAADLLRRGAIELDRFKCPDWPDMLAAARTLRPPYVHFNLHTNLTEPDKDTINRLCADTDTPYVNLHLSPRPTDVHVIALDNPRPHERGVIHAIMKWAVFAAVDTFGADRVIVENLPYHPEYGSVFRAAVEPELICRIVQETGCGFLLDISHARLAARSLGMDEHDYLAQLPGERLRELHVTGIGQDPAGRATDHLPFTEADWPFVDAVLARIRAGEWAQPWVMAFEYGGTGPLFEWRSEASVIAAQVPRLYELAHSVP